MNRTDALVSCILAALYGKVNSILAVGNDKAHAGGAVGNVGYCFADAVNDRDLFDPRKLFFFVQTVHSKHLAGTLWKIADGGAAGFR